MSDPILVNKINELSRRLALVEDRRPQPEVRLGGGGLGGSAFIRAVVSPDWTVGTLPILVRRPALTTLLDGSVVESIDDEANITVMAQIIGSPMPTPAELELETSIFNMPNWMFPILSPFDPVLITRLHSPAYPLFNFWLARELIYFEFLGLNPTDCCSETPTEE